jgi:zinc transporter ZupT
VQASLEADGLLFGFAAAAGIATSLGGLIALRIGAQTGLLLGFGGGVVCGVAFFDLLPEALDIAGGAFSALAVMTAAACGFAAYLVLDRAARNWGRSGAKRGHARAGLLTAHSLVDGLGVGFAFRLSTTAGLILAAAVVAHDLLDGANTVTLSLSAGPEGAAPRRWLAADAVAPTLGIVLAHLIPAPKPALGLLLAVFAGMLLNMGGSELLPQSHSRRPRLSTTLATLLGFGAIYAVVRFAGER